MTLMTFILFFVLSTMSMLKYQTGATSGEFQVKEFTGLMLMHRESGSAWQWYSEVWSVRVEQENSSNWRVCSRRQEPFPLPDAGTGERLSARAEIRAGRSASATVPSWPRGWFTWERWTRGTGQGLQAAWWWMGQTQEKMGGEGGERWGDFLPEQSHFLFLRNGSLWMGS